MLKFILYRILSGALIILTVLLFAFFLQRKQNVTAISFDDQQNLTQSENGSIQDAVKDSYLHLPAFYFSLQPKHYPKDIHKIFPIAKRQQTTNLLQLGLSISAIQKFHRWVETQQESKRPLAYFYSLNNIEDISLLYDDIRLEKRIPKKLFPSISIHWNGLNNAYHSYLSDLFSGQFAKGFFSREKVSTVIMRAFVTTTKVTGLAFILTLLIGIPLGLLQAKIRSNWLNTITYIFLTIPSFILVIFAIRYLTGSGAPFPGPGLMAYQTGSWNFIKNAALPILIIAIPSGLYLSLLIPEHFTHNDLLPKRDFYRMLGKTENQIWFHEMFSHAIIPVTATFIGLSLPAFLGGTVIIEKYFGIPGLGTLAYNSMLSRDWSIIIAICMLSALLTTLGFLCTDILILFIDPKHRNNTRNERSF